MMRFGQHILEVNAEYVSGAVPCVFIKCGVLAFGSILPCAVHAFDVSGRRWRTCAQRVCMCVCECVTM